MTARNLRHLRLLVAVANTGSLTQAAEQSHFSQPAVSQAIGKLERYHGGALFDRTRHGVFATARGEALTARVRRAFDLLDPALADVSPRLTLTATTAQLQALVAAFETENFTLAARRLNLAQPTVHRTISQLEKEAGRTLFERTSYGLVPARRTRTLVQAVMLAFREFDQAEADLAEMDGGDAGRIVVGSLPLSRSVLLPQALVAFHRQRPRQTVTVIDGRYGELLSGLRRGEIDVIVGALRYPAPIEDIVQERLFDDGLAILAGRHHPLVGESSVSRETLRACNWVVPRPGTPARAQFDAFFGEGGAPQSIIEAGSILLMREILGNSDHLGCISSAQAQAELRQGLVEEVTADMTWRGRPIGLTYRVGWAPTVAQTLLLDLLRETARNLMQ
ncbi:MAG: LysR family transcriptional regulator [Pseudomonadota bacterium]